MDNLTLKTRLTKTVVATAEARNKEFIVWDSGIQGFGLRVRPTGSKSYVFVYRIAGGRAGKVQKVTIGNAATLHIETAREQARKLSSEHHGGGDPAKEKTETKEAIAAERDAPTVSDALDMFVEQHVRVELKPSTQSEYERVVEKIIKPAMGDLKIAAVNSEDVSKLYESLRSTPTQAAGTIRVLSSAMNLFEQWKLRTAHTNPCLIRLKASRRRDRLFSDFEVHKLQSAIDVLEAENKITPSVALALRLLFATGCRAGEICGLEWENVDLAEGFISWPDSKTGKFEKAITAEAAKIFETAPRFKDCNYVCPSPALKRLSVETLEAAFERAMRTAKVVAGENATLHLIRHWFSTKTYNDPSITLNMQMKIVGHKSVATAMRYAHASKEDIKKYTLKAEKKRLAAIRAAAKKAKADNVVPMVRR